MTDRPEILCVGRLYCDLIFTGMPRMPTFGTEVFCDSLSLHAGGGAFITAAHLSALGHRVGLATFLPAAPFSTALEAPLSEAGLDLSLCQPAPQGCDPQVTVAMVGAEDRAFLSRRSGDAVPKLTAQDLNGLKHLHIGELATLVECPWLLRAAREAGLSISLDCGWDDSLNADCADLIAAVDIFLPNAMETTQLRSVGLREPFAPLVVVKRGKSGATAFAGPDRTEASVLPIEAKDTTGAGDAFNAGFLNGWLAQRPLAECLAMANSRAARSIVQRGGYTPSKSDLRMTSP